MKASEEGDMNPDGQHWKKGRQNGVGADHQARTELLGETEIIQLREDWGPKSWTQTTIILIAISRTNTWVQALSSICYGHHAYFLYLSQEPYENSRSLFKDK